MAKTDFISKKALLKELRKELRECRADAVDYGGENILWAEGIEFAIDTVKNAKPIDAVKVVRCKDCKHLTVHNSPTLYAYCEKTHYRFEPFKTDTRMHFCSYGERRCDTE